MKEGRQPSLIAIVGPTASGKSDLGIALAARLQGEIINCDSVQVFQGIEIATAKVPLAERQGIPHHLLDLVPSTYEMTAVEWATRAREVIQQIEARGNRAFFVGGTGFYLKALTMQFCDTPPIDPGIRLRLQELLRRRGADTLHRLLCRVDAPLATLYSPRDWSRVLRALEVRFSTGLPLSEWQRRSPVRATPEAARLHYFVLRPPREALYQRIDRRVEEMVARGLLAEIEALLAEGVPPTARAFQAHGYKRFVEYLLGQRTLDSAIEQMKLDTRHYAKRQWTWWRAQSPTVWLDGFGSEPAVLAAALQAIEEIDASPPDLTASGTVP